ncbi:fumarylacetoacetate hydrolase [Catellatospora sp. TT07R-123]|uniref:fumarylacetoacetate hydrolase family protein n=1 Tax=Catellatospora sp. TT07R-123 TaxID=2733863 RepID=UPI001B1A6976|nr:fumarylacetoacetate hydrolase family protein [Catellatospora sp. TT07R-123]GHJ47095.1 fumarylacetoacetate hydrolase [Catellatospora sp. TT07R-123]
MRVYNLAGRLALGVGADGAVDVETASEGRFTSSPQAVYERWDEFAGWARGFAGPATLAVDPARLEAPVPRPAQVFAIGLNYRDHAAEAGLALPDRPVVFTKFPASVTGPNGDIERPAGSVDFEAELVAVIGRRAEHVAAADAWDHIAGFTAGQDLSERELQFAGSAPQQFNLGKSYRGFAPIGPALVTLDEFADPGDLELGCQVNGRQMQKARTADMIFSIPQLVEYLSAVLPLLPGDLIFTGTPSGIGWARQPKELLQAGDELVTWVETIGRMRHRFVAPQR